MSTLANALLREANAIGLRAEGARRCAELPLIVLAPAIDLVVRSERARVAEANRDLLHDPSEAGHIVVAGELTAVGLLPELRLRIASPAKRIFGEGPRAGVGRSDGDAAQEWWARSRVAARCSGRNVDRRAGERNDETEGNRGLADDAIASPTD